ncbi:MAG: GPW/gp25 family protein [Synechococcales bacterium]|nr:GPW/gp25 family protein [Synechococcales bacterium]
MQINYPFRIDGRGRVAEADPDAHIRQLIEQVLFTRIGERVNRPDFGGGLQQLIFGPNSVEVAAATQLLVQGALEQWLGDLIQVEAVEVDSVDARLEITVRYLMRRNQEEQVAVFVREG